MRLGVDTQILWADSPAILNGSRFSKNETSPAHGTTAEMDEMPIVCKSVRAAVLAHRRNRDPVAELNVAYFERCKEMGSQWRSPGYGNRRSAIGIWQSALVEDLFTVLIVTRPSEPRSFRLQLVNKHACQA